MDIGRKINRLRTEKGMTLEELGDKVGVGKSTVRKWEKGIIANMKRDKILKVAEALETSPSYLMGWEDESNNTVTKFKSKDTISKIEDDIIKNVNQMNDKGKKMMYDYSKVIIGNPDFIKQKDEHILNAAHKRTDIDPTQEDMDHDQKLMEDDDLWK